VAYESNTGTEFQVFVQPFPTTGARYLIGNGIHPMWSADAKTIFFVAGGARPAYGSVSFGTQPSVAFGNFEPVPLTALFDRGPSIARDLDALPDGKRFVGLLAQGASPSGPPAVSQFHVVLNWFEELKTRVTAR
jgi:hypothetical protein